MELFKMLALSLLAVAILGVLALLSLKPETAYVLVIPAIFSILSLISFIFGWPDFASDSEDRDKLNFGIEIIIIIVIVWLITSITDVILFYTIDYSLLFDWFYLQYYG